MQYFPPRHMQLRWRANHWAAENHLNINYYNCWKHFTSNNETQLTFALGLIVALYTKKTEYTTSGENTRSSPSGVKPKMLVVFSVASAAFCKTAVSSSARAGPHVLKRGIPKDIERKGPKWESATSLSLCIAAHHLVLLRYLRILAGRADERRVHLKLQSMDMLDIWRRYINSSKIQHCKPPRPNSSVKYKETPWQGRVVCIPGHRIRAYASRLDFNTTIHGKRGQSRFRVDIDVRRFPRKGSLILVPISR